MKPKLQSRQRLLTGGTKRRTTYEVDQEGVDEHPQQDQQPASDAAPQMQVPFSALRAKHSSGQVTSLFKELRDSLKRSARVIDSMHGSNRESMSQQPSHSELAEPLATVSDEVVLATARLKAFTTTQTMASHLTAGGALSARTGGVPDVTSSKQALNR